MGFINQLIGAKNDQWATPISLTGSVQDNPNGELVNTQQTALAHALTAAMNGQGPSVAQDQLKKATGQAVNQGASAIASQRGINPALQAKMILDQQQKTLGDSAAASSMLRNQEQQQATGQLAGVLGTQRGQDIQQQQTQNQGIANQNNAITQAQLGTEKINADIGSGNAGHNAKTGGGLLSGIGGMLGLAEGGAVPEKKPLIDIGGMLKSGIQSLFGTSPAAETQYSGPSSQDYANLYGAPDATEKSNMMTGGAPTSYDYASMYGAPGGAPMDADRKATMLNGGMPLNQMKAGGKVGGKANVAGDSKENDTVPALLSPGEEVIPRSAAGDPKLEKEFLEHLHKSKEKKGSKAGYANVVQAQQHLHARLSDLEKMCYGGQAA